MGERRLVWRSPNGLPGVLLEEQREQEPGHCEHRSEDDCGEVDRKVLAGPAAFPNLIRRKATAKGLFRF